MAEGPAARPTLPMAALQMVAADPILRAAAIAAEAAVVPEAPRRIIPLAPAAGGQTRLPGVPTPRAAATETAGAHRNKGRYPPW